MPGELFVIRNAGNTATHAEGASGGGDFVIAFAVDTVGF